MCEPLPILATAAPGWLDTALRVVLIPVLLVLSAAFSGSEAALFSLTQVQRERAASSSSPLRRLVAAVLARPKQALMTILVANTAVNTLLFANTYVLFHRIAAQIGAWVLPLAGVASVLLVVVCGEVVPKVLAVGLADRLAPWSAVLVRTTAIVAEPLGRLIDVLLAEPVARVLLGARRQRSAAGDLSAEEVKALLELSRRSGAIRPLEDTFLRPILDLSSTRVADVMVPRVDIAAYDIDAPAAGLRDLMRATHHKKIPVYQGTLDRVLGLVYAKVLFLNPQKSLRDLVVPVRFVPEIITCEQLLGHFRQTRTQIAIAVDEYGGVAGLVTLEDVLEQIVGELHDPEDQPDEPDVQALPSGEYEISGLLNVHHWVELFGLPPRVERVATVGGLVMAQLGRPARVGDLVQLGNVELRVVRVRRRRIDRLSIRLLDQTESPAP